MLTWELLGAAVGAGLASGREIASFFGRYGVWGYAGIALAGGALALLAGARMPPQWRGRWPERLWRVLSAMLLTVTGGAMLAGAGEVAAMAASGLRWPAMAATLLLAWLLAQRTTQGLAWVSRALLAVMAALLVPGLALPPMRAGSSLAEAADVLAGLLRGVTYGGFNAALMQPLLAESRDPAAGRSLRTACCLLCGLLAAGLTALLRHPALLGAPMPFLQLAAGLGRAGGWLAAASLYLAVLSTLTACVRALGGGVKLAGVVLAALLGFSGVVEAAYPLLGGACAVMLAAMRSVNFTNSSSGTFHSRRGML